MSRPGGFTPGTLYSGLEIMRQVNGHHIFFLAQMVVELETICAEEANKDQNKKIPEHHKTPLKTIMDSLKQSSLPVSINLIETYHDMAFDKDSTVTYSFLKPALFALKESIFAELRTMLFFRMDESLRSFYESSPLFGSDVALKFTAASFDIEEGGKCLALQRPTACVFHMMRVMEVGLRHLAKDLKVPYAPSWESYIRQIDAQITAKHKSKSNKWKAIEPFYRDVLGNLMAIKIAWRNPTMHIVRNYTPDEAEDVLRAVRTFMHRLSERFSQA